MLRWVQGGRKLRDVAVLATFLCLCAGNTLAQTPPPASQLTPETLRPSAGPGEAGIALPESAPLQVPAGADKLSVAIADVEFQGEFADLATAVAALTRTVVGRRLTVAQLYAYAYAVEQTYAAAGYVLVRVVVPPQKLVDGGTLKLAIVDGYIEKVDVTRLSGRVRSVAAARMASIVGKRHIKLAEIERNVLLAGEVPGLRLRSTLVRGREQGGTLLVLEGHHKVVQGAVNTNNFLDESYGRWQFTGSAALNSAFGFGELLYGTYSGSDDLESTFDGTSPLRIVGGGAVIPLGSDGLTLNPEYTMSRARPIASPGVPDTEDVFERYAVRLAYPIILTRARSLRIQGIYEHINAVSEALGFGDLNLDRYEVVRLRLDHNWVTLSGNPLLTAVTFSQGLGGRGQDEAAASGVPLSRQGAQPDFHKLLFEARYLKALPESFRLDLVGRAQTSFGDPLLESEQLSLDSPDTLSGFDSGTLVVDQGFAARIELSRPFVVPNGAWAKVVTPYTFAAFGRGSLLEPTAVEQETVQAASLGVGARAAMEGPDDELGGSITFEAARHYSDDPDIPDGYRGSFTAGVHF